MWARFSSSYLKKRNKQKQSNFTVEKPSKYHLHQVKKANISYDCVWLSSAPWHDTAFPLSSFKNPHHQANPDCETYSGYLTRNSQDCQGSARQPLPQAGRPSCGTKAILSTNLNTSAGIWWGRDFLRITGHHQTRQTCYGKAPSWEKASWLRLR